jgi:uncharacterized coiled-coil protein SlyX
MDSEMILLKKELATNRSYTIKLEQDIVDLETSLNIQKQKNKINSQEGSLNGTHHNEQYENIKTLLLEQRIKTMEHEVLKQDSKMNLLSDKVMDMKMEFTLSGNQYRRPARKNRSNKYENEKKQADYIDISSSPSVGDDLIESDYNYRTDEVPVAQTNRNDNHFLEEQGQRKHVRIKEPNIPTNRKRSMQTNVHKPIKKPTVSQPPPQIHTGLQAPMMHLPYQSLVPQQNNMVKLPPRYPQMFAPGHPMIRHAIYPRHYTQPMNVLQQLQTRN